MHSRRTIVALLGIGAGLALGFPALGQVGADLNVAPKRVVMGAEARSATVFVFNRGGAPVTYNISLVDRVMTPDGQITAVDALKPGSPEAAAAADLHSAKSMILYTPRRVTLQPGESQTLRLRVLRPADLPAGEYRTHLTVTAVPPEDTGLTAEQAANPGEGQLAARVVAVFAISIPVIVRQGPADTRAVLDNVRFLAPSAADAAGSHGAVACDLVRAGGSSLFGDIEIRSAGASPSSAPIGVLRGIGVYAEIARRQITVALDRAPAKGERLEISFKDQDLQLGSVLTRNSLSTP